MEYGAAEDTENNRKKGEIRERKGEKGERKRKKKGKSTGRKNVKGVKNEGGGDNQKRR